jgi:TP901 family phage tail tape measure protein
MYDEETESLSEDLENISGDIADLTKTAKTPGGISLFTDSTKQTYKSTYEILKEISEIYNDLSDKTQAQLLEKLAGKRNGQVVAGLLSNFSAAKKAMENMENAAGSADAEMSIVEDTITYKINALKETWVGIIQDIINRDDFGTLIERLTKLSEVINTLINNVGVLGTIGIGTGVIALFKNFGGLKKQSSIFQICR